MVKKMIEVTLLLPDTIVKYLKAKFPTKEEGEAYIVRLIRADMDAPESNTSQYRRMRQRVIDLNDTGKEITAETLAAYDNCAVQVARDWLARFAKHKLMEMVGRKANGKKVYRWIGTSA